MSLTIINPDRGPENGFSEINAVGFDIDGLVQENFNSWLSFSRHLAEYFSQRDLADFVVNQHIKLFSDYKQGKIEYKTVVDELISTWTQMKGKEITEEDVDAIVQMVVNEGITESFIALVKQLQTAGFTLFLISASFDKFVEAFAERLGIENYFYNSHLTFIDDGNKTQLRSFAYNTEEEHLKLDQLVSFLKEQNIPPKEAIYFDDKLAKLLSEVVPIVALQTISDDVKPYVWGIISRIEDVMVLLDEPQV